MMMQPNSKSKLKDMTDEERKQYEGIVKDFKDRMQKRLMQKRPMQKKWLV